MEFKKSTWCENRKKERDTPYREKKGRLPAAVKVNGSHMHVLSSWHSGVSLSDPHLTFPTKNPILTTTFIYICVIILHKLHSSLNNLQAVLHWGSPLCF